MKRILPCLAVIGLLMSAALSNAAPYYRIMQGDRGGFPINRTNSTDLSMLVTSLDLGAGVLVQLPASNLGGWPEGAILPNDALVFYVANLAGAPLTLPVKLRDQASCDLLGMGPEFCDNGVDWLVPQVAPLGSGQYQMTATARSVVWSPYPFGVNISNNQRGQLAPLVSFSTDGGVNYSVNAPAGVFISGICTSPCSSAQVPLTDNGVVYTDDPSGPRSTGGFDMVLNCGSYVGPLQLRAYVEITNEEDLAAGGIWYKDKVDFTAINCP